MLPVACVLVGKMSIYSILGVDFLCLYGESIDLGRAQISFDDLGLHNIPLVKEKIMRAMPGKT